MNSVTDTHTLPRPQLLTALSLLLLMVLTRSGHFSSLAALPDASLAVFFLLGLFVRSPVWLAATMFLAATVDVVVIAGGVSADCVPPAYAFLIPTYAAMWFAGRWARDRHATLAPATSLAATLLAAAIGTLVAFLTSNGSYYLFSGQFPNLSATQYAARVSGYLPPYFGCTLMYVGAGLTAMLASTWARRSVLRPTIAVRPGNRAG